MMMFIILIKVIAIMQIIKQISRKAAVLSCDLPSCEHLKMASLSNAIQWLRSSVDLQMSSYISGSSLEQMR